MVSKHSELYGYRFNFDVSFPIAQSLHVRAVEYELLSRYTNAHTQDFSIQHFILA